METIYGKLSNNKYTLILAFVLSMSVYLLSQFATKPLAKILVDDLSIDFNTPQSVLKILMLVFSLVIMLLLNKGNLKEFGFKRPEPIDYFRLTWITIVVVIVSISVSGIIFLGILNELFPRPGVADFSIDKSFVKLVVTVWCLSTLSETILTRGLFQSLLNNLKHIKVLKLSLPVIATGLFFGLLHGTAFFSGKSIWFALHMVCFTSCTGMVVAFYREKSDSLIPAFLVHFLANIVGSVPLLVGMGN